MEPFEKGWATRTNTCGNMYGLSHWHLYEKERAEMFAREQFKKISATNMKENITKLYCN